MSQLGPQSRGWRPLLLSPQLMDDIKDDLANCKIGETTREYVNQLVEFIYREALKP